MQINGVLLLNKPSGISSNKALQIVKRIYQASKAGHTGTLDPLATGLLPICFGEATKFASMLLEGKKEYMATIQLGQATTTYDAEGEITFTSDAIIALAQVQQALIQFQGEIEQQPPIYSALKVNGQRLYQYAKLQQTVEIKTRKIIIYAIDLIEYNSSIQQIKLQVMCSKGTYIRSLAHDIGKVLGCGGYLANLIRTQTLGFSLDADITIEKLKSLRPDQLQQFLLPIDCLVQHLPKYNLSNDEYLKVKNGHAFKAENQNNLELATLIRIYYNNIFLGIGHYNNADFIIQPKRLVRQILN
jgi:tRNA pseudouridine55 synthase